LFDFADGEVVGCAAVLLARGYDQGDEDGPLGVGVDAAFGVANVVGCEEERGAGGRFEGLPEKKWRFSKCTKKKWCKRGNGRIVLKQQLLRLYVGVYSSCFAVRLVSAICLFLIPRLPRPVRSPKTRKEINVAPTSGLRKYSPLFQSITKMSFGCINSFSTPEGARYT
jgi:hypothetical protein